MASTKERLQGFVQRRIMTDSGWKYFCTECNDYHPADDFYKAANRPFGLFSHCSKTRQNKNKKGEPALRNVDTTHLKLNKVTEEDIQNTLEVLTKFGYDTTGNVHEQFLKKYENEIKNAISQRQKNPPRTIKKRF